MSFCARPIVLASLFVLPSACVSRGDLRTGVLAVLRHQEDAWNRGDLDGFLDGYAQVPELSFSSAQGTLRGWGELRDRYRRRYPDSEAMGKLSFDGLEVEILAPEAALVTGRWRLDRASDAPHGVFSLVFVQRDGVWTILHDHTSQFVEPETSHRESSGGAS